MTVILESDPLTASGLRTAAGDAAAVVDTFDSLGIQPGQPIQHSTVVVGPSVDTEVALDFAETIRRADPTCGVLLVRRRVDTGLMSAAMSAGVREVVAERDLPALTAAVRRSNDLTRALRRTGPDKDDSESRSGRVVTVWSPKGGCGKTTIAVNVAVSLAGAGHRVLLVDLDLAFGDVAISLGMRPAHDFNEVVAMGEGIDRSALNSLLTQHASGVQILTPPNEPGVAERVDSALVARLLSVARTDFDYVVIDSAPVLDERNVTLLESSDVVLMPTILDIPSIKNLRVGVDTLRLINYPVDRLKVVLNRADLKVGLNASEVDKSLRLPVAGSIPDSLDVPTAMNRGLAITLENHRHPVSRAIDELIASVVLKPEHVKQPSHSVRLPWRKSA